MTPTNAIAKVRFSSAKPQRVHLAESGRLASELLCLESGQHIKINEPDTILYVILGAATIEAGDQKTDFQTGHLLAPGAACTLTNAGEQRLVCLACKATS